jgi:ribose/xylose/arabinose/galactoside ABC-type transport system permease subunit
MNNILTDFKSDKSSSAARAHSMIRFRFTYNWALLVITLLLFMIFGIMNSTFFTYYYIMETIKTVIEIAIMSLPITMIIIMGGIDFSMSSTLILSAVCGGIVGGWTNPLIGLVAALIVGVLCGIFNGFLIAKLNLPPLVTTLATMYLIKGVAEGITMGIPSVGVSISANSITTYLGTGNILGVPVSIWLFAVLAVIFHLLLSKTYFGRIIYAIGLNENSTKFAGIDTVKIKFIMYGLGGLMFAIAGTVFIGRFSAVKFDAADPLLFQVIIAVVLGGTNIAGGYGNIKGTILGVLIIGVLTGGMNVLFVPQTQQKIILGVMLIVCLILNTVVDDITKRRKRELTPEVQKVS